MSVRPQAILAAFIRTEVEQEKLGRILSAQGYTMSYAEDRPAALENAREWPDLILLDLDLHLDDGFAVLRELKKDGALNSIPILAVLSQTNRNLISKLVKLGVDDVLLRPYTDDELVMRVRSYLKVSHCQLDLKLERQDHEMMLELTRTLTSTLDTKEILFKVASRLTAILDVDRCSIVLMEGDSKSAYVLVASEDRGVRNIHLELAKYPEIQRVVNTRSHLLIGNVAQHPLTGPLKDIFSSKKIQSLILFPILFENQLIGVLFMRSMHSRETLSTREELIARIVANATAVALRNAQILEKFHGRTEQLQQARLEAERQVQVHSLFEHILSRSQEGVIAIDARGRILSVNFKSSAILGHTRKELAGKPLEELVPEECQQALSRILAVFQEEASIPEDVEIKFYHQDKQLLLFFVGVNTLLLEEGVLILFIRDLTAQRRLIDELEQTRKVLLELVEKAPYALSACDKSGKLILFNRNAERLFGYKAEEVIGKIYMTELFPDGVCEHIMDLMNSDKHGKRGVLDRFRQQVKTKNGEGVPVNISALVLYDNGVVTANVHFFIDLSERFQVERQLIKVREQLLNTERHKAFNELAGTTAHELNQPLTSVMGYAELMKRKMEQSDPNTYGIDIIIREAERMAEIVRRISKITKYETKPYVGNQRIIDLDRSSEE